MILKLYCSKCEYCKLAVCDFYKNLSMLNFRLEAGAVWDVAGAGAA
jgi:hypothetical protein